MRRTYQVQRSSNQVISHTGTILRSTSSNKNHTVLLNIMSLARDIRRNNRTRRELHTSRLSFTRVGLLRSHDTDTQTHALESRAVRIGQRRGDGVACSLALSNAAQDLVEGGLRGGSG